MKNFLLSLITRRKHLPAQPRRRTRLNLEGLEDRLGPSSLYLSAACFPMPGTLRQQDLVSYCASCRFEEQAPVEDADWIEEQAPVEDADPEEVTAVDSTGGEDEPAAAFPITEAGQSLAAVYDQMDVENHWLAHTKLNKPDVDGSPVLDDDGEPVVTSVTHCDAFVKRACDLLGAPMTPGEGSRDHANQQYDWLVEQAAGHTNPLAEGWHEVDALQAQQLANQGFVVVAACRNLVGKPGHVAMVRPSDKDVAAILDSGPEIIQAGQENFNSTDVATGFKVHPGAWGDPDDSNTPVHFFVYRSAGPS